MLRATSAEELPNAKASDSNSVRSSSQSGGNVILDTPWERARKTKSQLQEERLGRLEGGRKQVNSGRIWPWKRDNILREFLVEARTTDKKSYRIEQDEMLAIKIQGLQCTPALLPAMQIDFPKFSGIFIELNAFNDLYHRLIELEARVELAEQGKEQNPS